MLSKISSEELWKIYEENKQLANLWELIEPLEKQRVWEEQQGTQKEDEKL